ncbi:molybdenum cofactor biosynthesis protein MoaE [Roseiconus nitratireducens]|uniref:Molybdopterin synthase catalytic subunit n=1 Tax=Roseiconus nitratireducens TaxID=2605748 RepID=A0A5M6DIW2_9BACT|nr:molybdenum cofactor biosynthesis protein MoaE [Roseiconus nitratireducens]KAA5546200.1 molybdenum cofactor biosynthesis protein MoaE [Roseiconus nitratireducens]
MSDSQCIVCIQSEPIELSEWQRHLSDPDSGAQAWFLGCTRRTTISKAGTVHRTRTLSYQAYTPMARRELESLAEAARERFSLSRLIIVHRLGEVPIGQASVLIACSSAHRPDAFAALPWIMDRLKRDVPIWKQEWFEDDSRQWIHPTEPDPG